jgi:hypothetical protein
LLEGLQFGSYGNSIHKEATSTGTSGKNRPCSKIYREMATPQKKEGMEEVGFDRYRAHH